MSTDDNSTQQVTVIGTGFVGVVTAAVLASFGNIVYGLDIDPQKIESLKQGQVPFHEPGLSELLQAQLAAGNLHFTTSYSDSIPDSDIVMVAVGTPSAPDGTADLTYVKSACESLASYLKNEAVVCIKSTVPPGVFGQLEPLIAAKTDKSFVMASLPEFLREGTAVADTLHPDRVVIGCEDETAVTKLKKLHQPFEAPMIVTKPESAQMGKYTANAYLASRIMFINQIADLCEVNGANVDEVIKIIGQDQRIGSHYWYPGLGYGGSCFPKDVRELAAYSRTVGQGNNLFNKIHELNQNRIFDKLQDFSSIIGGWSQQTVAVLGLSFKPNTDDMREAPSTKVIPHLLHQGALVKAYDPMANQVAKQIMADHDNLQFASSLEEALQDSSVVILLIEWPELVAFDYPSLPSQVDGHSRVMIDVRNQLDGEEIQQAGWKYIQIGSSYEQE